MKKHFLLTVGLLLSLCVAAQMEPIFYETFDRCIDAEDENYGYTGGNDGQWGGDIAKAIVIYTDANDAQNPWTYDYANGAYQCAKVGTSKKQGWLKTPVITHTGDAELSCRVAPWEGDSIFTISLSGGTTTDECVFHLKKHQWTTVTVRISDIRGSLQVTFSSTNKHRFFIDDVCVRPADPNAGVIRTEEGTMLDFGLLGRNYHAVSQTLHVTGANLTADGISATLADGETNLFQLAASSLPAEGGDLTVTCKAGASEGAMHGCYLYLRGKDKTTQATVEKRITLVFEVATLSLQGSGTKSDPYTCADRILLANNDGTVWTDTYYWVTGYVLGGVKRYNNQFDGISLTDNLSLVLADKPDETNTNKYVTVQIGHDARAALNVVDNPELIGKIVKVQGLLLNDSAEPYYLGLPGVRNVNTHAQYERPDKEQGVESVNSPDFNGQIYDILGRPVDADYHGIVIRNGQKYIK